MKTLKLILGLCLGLGIILTGCNKEDLPLSGVENVVQIESAIVQLQNLPFVSSISDYPQPAIRPIPFLEVPENGTLPGNLPAISQEDAELLATSPETIAEHELGLAKSVVTLPAGSVDGLAAAIMAAGKNGTVKVEAGQHFESSTVVISKKVRIVGEPGAELVFTNTGAVAALHVIADHVKIVGLEIYPANPPFDIGILVENAAHCQVKGNLIHGQITPVVVEQGNFCRIVHNTLVADGFLGQGLLIANGDHAKVIGNDMSNGFFGAFVSDGHGLYIGNNTHDNGIGLILCKVPANGFPLPDGTLIGSEFAANNWHVVENSASNNLLEGYLVIDGANNNTLVNNTASNNGTYDVELAGESMRFGFTTPTSASNLVVDAGQNLIVKDCGDNNTVIGGNQVDTSLDPCM